MNRGRGLMFGWVSFSVPGVNDLIKVIRKHECKFGNSTFFRTIVDNRMTFL